MNPTIPAPQPMQTFPKKRSKAVAIILAVVILVLLGVLVWLGYWVYTQQNDHISQLNRQVTSLTSQLNNQPKFDFVSTKGVAVKVFTPVAGAKLGGTLTVVGMVPGNWSQEASFTVQLKNSQGVVVAQAPAQLHGNWMTESLVPFTATLTVPSGQTGPAILELHKANPSGLPAHDDVVSIALSF